VLLTAEVAAAVVVLAIDVSVLAGERHVDDLWCQLMTTEHYFQHRFLTRFLLFLRQGCVK
jgi:hypothetical protein